MRLLLMVFLLLTGGAAMAQPVSLVADSVRIESDNLLVAEGNVEVFYENRRLTAERITYNRETEELTIDGSIHVTEDDGEVAMYGNAAQLESGLRDGILTSARIVLDQQLQIAADELATIDGRYRRLTNAVASSCRVCPGRPTPLWEIRAARVLHDTEERQIYFTHAQFRVIGVPLAYIPRLRLPDPTVERARGFLTPELKGAGDVGQGLRVPYFIPLGRSADITVAPWITGNSRTVELRYRQRFRSGSLNAEGAFSRDDLVPGETRSYISAQARFRLPWRFRLAVDVEAASDETYADQYDYDEGARLQSRLGVYRSRQDEVAEAWLYNYDILRPGSLDEGDRALVNFGAANYERAFATRFGRLTMDVDANIYDRNSDQAFIGRDMRRIGAGLGWAAGTVLPLGVALEAEAEVRADSYSISNDPSYDSQVTRLSPAAAVALRWPFARSGAGVHEMVEPVAQLVWSDVSGGDVPNEDSRIAELDEGSLFALDRYPGEDRSETGTRLNVGLGYSRLAADWQINGYVGRVYRFDDLFQFNDTTGLNGEWSDWLVSGQIGFGDWITVTNRAVFDDDFDVARNELRLALEAGAAEFATSYLWLVAEPAEDRNRDIHEAIFNAGLEFNRHWYGAIESRWDLEAERIRRTDYDLTYRNECITVDLYLSREYESRSTVDPTYSYGVEVSLAGFGSNDASRYARSCPG